MSFLINPFVFAAAGDFESIATVTVGSGGATYAEFTGIPSTFQHLQVRVICRYAISGTEDDAYIRLNGDSGTNYSRHDLRGNGSAASAGGAASQNRAIFYRFMTGDSNTANVFGAGVVDILDYADTSKNTTIRAFGGNDVNGTGTVTLASSVWLDTSAVTSIRFGNIFATADLAEHSVVALYGIRA